MLTTHFPASTFHKLLPKLGVRTRAADSKDLLSVLNSAMLASSRAEQRSFFIGMMAEQPVPASLVASSVDWLTSNSFPQPTQEAMLSLQSTQRTFSLSSFWWHLSFFAVAWLCATPGVFTNVVSFQMCDLVLSAMLVRVKLYQFTVFVYHQFLLLQGHLCGGL